MGSFKGTTLEDGYNTGNVTGKTYVGGVCGIVESGGQIIRCNNTGTVKAALTTTTSTYIGGVAGRITSGSVIQCYNTGSVNTASNSNKYVGGVVGRIYTRGYVEKSYNIGNVYGGECVGGVVGYLTNNTDYVSNCYNTGAVSGTKYVGGIAGQLYRTGASVTTSYNVGTVTGNNYRGGAVGSGGTVTNSYYLDTCISGGTNKGTPLTAEQMTSDSAWITNYVGFNTTDVWSKETNSNGKLYLPKLDGYWPYLAGAEPETYTVIWQNWDGTELEKDGGVAYGTTPSYDGQTPTKAADAQNSYVFAGWTPEITEVTGDVTYKATFTSSTNTYTVIWQNWDGTELEKDENVPYGTTPAYNGQTPAKAGDAQNTYVFAGWTPAVSAVTGDVTYKATFTSSLVVYTIHYDANGGTGTMLPQSLTYGAADQYLTPNGFTREGYTFASWNTESDGSGDTYMDCAVIAAPWNGTLYVQWKRNVVIVSPEDAQTVTVCEGEQATMDIVAEYAVVYQWYVNYNDGTGWHTCGDNSATYASSPAKLSDNGYLYKCVVTGENDQPIESPIFTLEVLEKVALPQTGDDSCMTIWLAMLTMAGVGMIVLRKKARN